MSRRRRTFVLASALVAGACATGPAPEFHGTPPLDFPEPDAVDAVVFLIGDAGVARSESSPVLRRLGAEVEYWSQRLERDSAVTVVFLGDNVYPVGVRDRSHREFPTDSARLWSQVSTLAGPSARQRGAVGLFLAGNHDWGNTTGEAGVARLRNQSHLLDAARAQGIGVSMVPAPGEAGPWVRDVRSNVRLMALDTHWFLQAPDAVTRTDFFAEVRQALEDAEDRHVIMLAHHPYQSAGPHGLLSPGDEGFGILYLLHRSGTLVQDLNSPVYRDFRGRLDGALRSVGKRPLVFAAGHDHSLQVLDPDSDDGPETVLVSGSGSKLTPLTDADNLRYGASRPGYMSLVFRRNEAVDLYVMAAPTDRPACPDTSAEAREACMGEAVAALELVYSERLAPEASLPGDDDPRGR